MVRQLRLDILNTIQDLALSLLSHGISGLRLKVPEDSFMAIEFEQGALKKAAGIVEYPQEFSEL